jgi:hypothetical protein
MLFNTLKSPSLVSDEFNGMCVEFKVEAQVQVLPNPGNIRRSMRLITFRNFNDYTLKVVQFDAKQQVHMIPAKGTIQVMVAPDEQLPKIERTDNV